MVAVSVVIPAYNSHATVGRCLEAINRQTFHDFEVIVVDSSPDDRTAHVLTTGFPHVRYERSAQRLLPHAARNRGVSVSRADLVVFTDPDVYPAPDWLERLIDAHRAAGDVIVGSLTCHGARWFDWGAHLCKFNRWLPARRPRPTHMSPTANMLLSRRQFEAAGGLPPDQWLGDLVLSRRLRACGFRLWFEPRAVVAHHHLHTMRSFVRERYTRGKMYGDIRIAWSAHPRARASVYLAATVVPARMARILALCASDAWHAGMTGRYLATLPIIVAGHAASLAGEAVAYTRRLTVSGRIASTGTRASAPPE